MLTEFYGRPVTEVVIGQFLKEKSAEILYGAYSGYAIPMFNLPPTIVMALSMSVVPGISAAYAMKNHKEVKLLSESTLRITTLFSLPCAVGLSVLSQPILITVYNNARSAAMLSILAYAVIFVCLVSVTTAMLQAAGKVMVPVRNMAIGGVVKIVTNYLLIAVPNINIGGAPISTTLCYLTIAVLNIISVKRVLNPSLSLSSMVIKPVIAAGAMGVSAGLSYKLCAEVLGTVPFSFGANFMPQTQPVTPVLSDMRIKVIIALCISMAIAVIVYAVMVFALKLIKREDVLMLPKGEFLTRIMDKFHLLS